ncbi:probable LRR receptor-like serine/threonine-protein kinase At1g06840 [Arachis duranensis]|uniref:non-specific serine/threonine protein kinase n=1 Tax=Arachis duranensis TaxID=130453 RepID=A0A6P4CDA7_ARADU|nr:probable LRR receptor-like serine/threonine-protein kinase At1g06840 [Arachis duranensis]XP_015949218.1 probable LRR receptor-like serine/threonine-protein kinase At1g06840 [Arachis duranensis]XP_052116112.1 probable LRR receptor-like serine/threonine-protein kinase At1g06840 [Arachis duranensis]
MYLSKGCKHQVLFILWFCCYLLHVSAENNITDPVEVEALNAIKQRLNDPNGNLSNWGHNDPCTSKWTGVLCYNETLDDGYLHVQELQLLSLNLTGNLAPELGNLTRLLRLNFMWNKITGSIPKEIGEIKTLQLLLLNGNNLTGPLPDELGYLPNLDRIQIDQNNISGPVPKSFANLNKTKHFHMNNNSLSGQIPPELSRLPSLVHLLLDNNKLTGYLPSDLYKLPNLLIIQLDNNNFEGNTIPSSYGNMSKLLKMSLRNCNLRGPVPDLSRIPHLLYLDLSSNQLNGSIPSNKLSNNITTIDLSNNKLTGTIPSYFSSLPVLQRLSLENNLLKGSVSSTIWQNKTLNGKKFILELQNNSLTSISGTSDIPPNVTLSLNGNPLCSNNKSLVQFCGSETADNNTNGIVSTNSSSCPAQACPPPFEYSLDCFCAAPLLVSYRLKSPGFSDFRPYVLSFQEYLSTGLSIQMDQLQFSFYWQAGPRLRMDLKLFPVYVGNSSSHIFNTTELLRLMTMFTGWHIQDSDLFGPYELLGFNLLDPYKGVVIPKSSNSKISTGALAGIILGSIACAVTLSAIVTLLILRVKLKDHPVVSKRRHSSKISIKIDGVRAFTFGELSAATNNFSNSSQVGQGGYGKVYKGILSDGTVVAIKRAQEGSLQGEKEFLTEISLLSRLHHRNLVSLLGYCDEEGEQMLVYEFMPNGTLREHISVTAKEPLSFAMRLKIALGSAKGLMYLHTEADPPIFHRDVKASNILLDSKFTAKVADFGLSRLAPVPDLEGVVPGHVSTVVKGTPGYLDPEYFLTHKLTDKSDVYSLGVVFLELLTGMQPISHGKNIVREVNVAYQSGVIFSIIDDRMGSYPSEHVEKFLTLALKCCEDEPEARPKMAEVVRELENIWSMMPESDTRKAESITSDSGKLSTSTPSSSSAIKTPFVSGDVSGSDLVSGVIPSIKPR